MEKIDRTLSCTEELAQTLRENPAREPLTTSYWKLILSQTLYILKRFHEFRFFSKLWTAVYPSKIAPIGVKLRENAFQVIPDISFFDGTNTFCDQKFVVFFLFVNSQNIFSKVPVLEELCRFTHQCRMQLENSLPELSVSAFYDPWRRGKKGKNCFCREFWPQKTYTYFVFGNFIYFCLWVPGTRATCYIKKKHIFLQYGALQAALKKNVRGDLWESII